MQNFMVADLVETTLATLAFGLFLLPSGYLLGTVSDAFGMRNRSMAEKALFSSAFSIAATPILAVLLTRTFSYEVTIAVFLSLAVISAAMFARQLPRPSELFTGVRRSTWVLLSMMVGWFLLVQCSLADLQIGHRLYVSFVFFDHSVRVPLVEAAARTGVPPRNPFYGIGTIPVLRYFYYWYVVCALPVRLFGLSARACLDASVFWSGLGLASIIPLYLKYFLGEREDLRKKSVIGIALLGVTGLDLLPYAAEVHRYHMLLPDMEWWDTNQVTSWLGSLLWVPHHVASLTACMAGLLVLAAIDEESPPRETVWASILSGLAFASAAGLSVYVTFTFAVFMVIWSLLMLRRKQLKAFATYAAGGALALLLSRPYLSDLLSKPVNPGVDATAGGSGEHFAFAAIRDFPPATALLGRIGLHSSWLLELSKLPVLLFVYSLEFGFFAVIALLYLVGERGNPASLSRQQRMLWTMLAVGLLAMSFLKSNSSPQNDLGFRGMLVPQFVLLIWSAPLIYRVFLSTDAAAQVGLQTAWFKAPVFKARWIRISLLGTLALGVAGTAFQLLALRSYAPLTDSGRLQRSERFLGLPGFGERTYWMRDGFSRLNELTSQSTSVQYNPVRDEVLISHLYSMRQAVMGDAFCVSALGGDDQACRKAFPRIASIFNSPNAARKIDLDDFCDEFQVNVLVATDADPVWRDNQSWVWKRPSLTNNPSLRAVLCGSGLRSARLR